MKWLVLCYGPSYSQRHKGYPMAKNVLFQDNRSAMLLQENGCKNAGKRSRHPNMRFFFVTNQKAKGNINIEYCPTDQMKGDYMTKPLNGKKFTGFRQDIMNPPMTAQLMIVAICIAQRQSSVFYTCFHSPCTILFLYTQMMWYIVHWQKICTDP